jgi:hypothetical protein
MNGVVVAARSGEEMNQPILSFHRRCHNSLSFHCHLPFPPVTPNPSINPDSFAAGYVKRCTP